jgi:hypothetical protein
MSSRSFCVLSIGTLSLPSRIHCGGQAKGGAGGQHAFGAACKICRTASAR